MITRSIYYEPAYKAIVSQTSVLLRDFLDVQRQSTFASRTKTLGSLKEVCLKSISKQLKHSTGYPTFTNLHKGFYWFANPLDGEENFIRGNPLFAASITLMHDDNPLISLINLPFFKNIIWTEPGGGVHSNLGQYNVNRNLDIDKSYIAKNDFGCNTIAYLYTSCGNFDGFELQMTEVENRIAELFIKEANGLTSRIGPNLIGSNNFIHSGLRERAMEKTLQQVKRGISFCCGPTQKSPNWSGAVYEKALISKSHRSAEGILRIKEVQSLIRDVLQIPKDWKILLINGSATGAVESAFFNFLGHRPIGNVAYDVFGHRWAKEIKKTLENQKKIEKDKLFLVNLEYREYKEGEKTFYEIEDNFRGDLVFVYTGTSTGRRWQAFDSLKNRSQQEGLNICDATSAIFAESIPWEYLDVTCASFQKALGAEAGLGLVILSPKAVNQIKELGHFFTPPRIIRLDEAVIEEVTCGKLINTISMLNLEEIRENLIWAKENGGLNFLQKNCLRNQTEIIGQITEDFELMLKDPGSRALTVLCIQPKDPNLRNWDFIRKVATKAAELGVYEIAGHPEEAPCWRFWTGPTVNQAAKGFSKFLEAFKKTKL